MSEPLPSDRLFISRLRLRCIIGVRPHERISKQLLLLSVVLYTDVSDAAAQDSLSHTVDYSELQKKIINSVEGSSFELIEALAECVARICLADIRINRVEVTVEKPGASIHAETVGVTIHRHQPLE